MKKRSAMMIAAGLVASLLAGAIALATGFSGGNTAVAETPTGRVEPRVRTVERTITIHKKAKPEAAVVQTLPAPATQPVVASTGDDAPQATSDDEGWDEDGPEDEGYEDEADDREDDGEDEEDEDEGPEDD